MAHARHSTGDHGPAGVGRRGTTLHRSVHRHGAAPGELATVGAMRERVVERGTTGGTHLCAAKRGQSNSGGPDASWYDTGAGQSVVVRIRPAVGRTAANPGPPRAHLQHPPQTGGSLDSFQGTAVSAR